MIKKNRGQKLNHHWVINDIAAVNLPFADQDDYNSQTSKQFKQLMLSQSVQLLNKEQEVINTREVGNFVVPLIIILFNLQEIQKLETQIEELVSDKALNDYHSVKKKYEKLSKEKEGN